VREASVEVMNIEVKRIWRGGSEGKMPRMGE
jgi:hypothetical protein